MRHAAKMESVRKAAREALRTGGPQTANSLAKRIGCSAELVRAALVLAHDIVSTRYTANRGRRSKIFELLPDS